MNHDVEAKLRGMRERYRERVESDTAQLLQLIRALATGAGGETLDRIQRVAHQLAGSAGTFGFDDVGACAAALEREAIATRGDGRVTTAMVDAAGALAAAAARVKSDVP